MNNIKPLQINENNLSQAEIIKYICTKCEKQYNVYQKFCSECGSKIKVVDTSCIMCKCGARNELDARYCSICGKKLHKELLPKIDFKNILLNFKKDIIKNTILIGIIVLFIITSIIILNKPSEDQIYVESALEEVIICLKDPDSCKLRDDVVLFETDEGRCVYAMYAATNSYGAYISNYVYIINGKVYSANEYNNDTYTSKDDFETSEEYKEYLDNKSIFLLVDLEFTKLKNMNFQNKKNNEVQIFNKKEIAKRLNIKYSNN